MESHLIVCEEVVSTQDIAREKAIAGAPEGTAVMALKQTGGRGRAGHTWISPPGKNLALSLILRPKLPPHEAPLLGLAAAVAVAESIERLGVPRAELKWPNDVLADGRKVAGILSEAGMDAAKIHYAVIGLGLNVNSDLEDFPLELRSSVASMFLVTGRLFDLREVAQTFLDAMGALYETMSRQGCGVVLRRWEERWAHRGMPLVHEGVIGTAKGIDSDGALVLKTADGTTLRIASGDVLPIPYGSRPEQ